MRKPIIAGNWKMNMTPSQAKELVTNLIPLVKDAACDVVVCPPYVDIALVAELVKGTNIQVGAQNIHWAEKGAFTGEISAAMLKEAGAAYAIIGHSERRQYFGETDATVNSRTKAALAAGIVPIICVGEMRGPEANAAQEAARVGIAVLTTIHSNSSEGTYRRMVSLCKRAVDTPDDTLMGYVTEAYPIVVYCRQLENKQRRITNISECEILPDGSRRLHKLYEYHITDNHLEDNRFIIEGEHRKCEEISESLRRRFIENGMPLGELAQFVQGKEEDE